MSFDYIRKLPTPDEIREQYPVPDSLVPIKQKRDAEIRDVLTGKSDKLLVIIGPCSPFPSKASFALGTFL